MGTGGYIGEKLPTKDDIIDECPGGCSKLMKSGTPVVSGEQCMSQYPRTRRVVADGWVDSARGSKPLRALAAARMVHAADLLLRVRATHKESSG